MRLSYNSEHKQKYEQIDYFLKFNLDRKNELLNLMLKNEFVLKWLKNNGLPLPDVDGANLTAIGGHIEVLDWLKSNGLPLPNISGGHYAKETGNREVIKWLSLNTTWYNEYVGINL